MKRREAQTFDSAGALRFAKRTVSSWETDLQDLGNPLLPRGPIECGMRSAEWRIPAFDYEKEKEDEDDFILECQPDK